jgi:hypothetical protein
MPTGTAIGYRVHDIAFGHGDSPLEVAIASTTNPSPRMADVRELWKARQARRPAPVLLVMLHPNGDGTISAVLCGVTGDPAPIPNVPLDRAERVAAAGLEELDRHAAIRTLDRLLTGAGDRLLSGLLNSGLFATHELREGVDQAAKGGPGRCGRRAVK